MLRMKFRFLGSAPLPIRQHQHTYTQDDCAPSTLQVQSMHQHAFARPLPDSLQAGYVRDTAPQSQAVDRKAVAPSVCLQHCCEEALGIEKACRAEGVSRTDVPTAELASDARVPTQRQLQLAGCLLVACHDVEGGGRIS